MELDINTLGKLFLKSLVDDKIQIIVKDEDGDELKKKRSLHLYFVCPICGTHKKIFRKGTQRDRLERIKKGKDREPKWSAKYHPDVETYKKFFTTRNLEEHNKLFSLRINLGQGLKDEIVKSEIPIENLRNKKGIVEIKEISLYEFMKLLKFVISNIDKYKKEISSDKLENLKENLKHIYKFLYKLKQDIEINLKVISEVLKNENNKNT